MRMCKHLVTHNTGNYIFSLVDLYMGEEGLSRKWCVDIAKMKHDRWLGKRTVWLRMLKPLHRMPLYHTSITSYCENDYKRTENCVRRSNEDCKFYKIKTRWVQEISLHFGTKRVAVTQRYLCYWVPMVITRQTFGSRVLTVLRNGNSMLAIPFSFITSCDTVWLHRLAFLADIFTNINKLKVNEMKS